MLLRETSQGMLAISQTTHAWVSGQMAQAWGNELFGKVKPHDAVCLAAEQHDIGWTSWEQEPSFNPKTGLPHSFLELPPETHLRSIWSNAGDLALTPNRYAALLVSLHGTGLYDRFRGDVRAAGGLAAQFLAAQDAFQASLRQSLAEDPVYAPFVADNVVGRNRTLVALWDRISLNLCWGMADPLTIESVPLARGHGTLTLTPSTDSENTFTIDPWPFAGPEVSLAFEGRLLSQRYADQANLLRGLAAAPWQTIVTILRPA